jgi:hypothetical protein
LFEAKHTIENTPLIRAEALQLFSVSLYVRNCPMKPLKPLYTKAQKPEVPFVANFRQFVLCLEFGLK